MRLSSALASSFLFVPIVLTDYHPEKHQPRFFNSVNKNINDASTDRLIWAGASLLDGSNSEACLFRIGGYSAAIGLFTVPLAWGDHGPGVSIAVGIGGSSSVCHDSNVSFAAGIDVLLSDDQVSYAGWANWGTQVQSPLKFDIAIGDFIRASVWVYSATTGYALLENLSNGQAWREPFSVEQPAVCQKSAEWGVSALAIYPANVRPVPKFSTVTFVNTTAKTGGWDFVVPGASGAAIINNMEYNNTILTTAIASESVVVVAYELY